MFIATGTTTLGHTTREKVKVAFMRRADFVAEVQQLLPKTPRLTDGDVADLLAQAQTIEHFPLETWLTDRGCGCLVGEVIIGRSLASRSSGSGLGEILDAIEDSPLHSFGVSLDSRMSSLLYHHGVVAESIVLVD